MAKAHARNVSRPKTNPLHINVSQKVASGTGDMMQPTVESSEISPMETAEEDPIQMYEDEEKPKVEETVEEDGIECEPYYRHQDDIKQKNLLLIRMVNKPEQEAHFGSKDGAIGHILKHIPKEERENYKCIATGNNPVVSWGIYKDKSYEESWRSK